MNPRQPAAAPIAELSMGIGYGIVTSAGRLTARHLRRNRDVCQLDEWLNRRL